MLVVDVALTAVHTLLVVFLLIGWSFRRLRRIHLVLVLLTMFSWFVLGIWYGWGYCFLTDWAWTIKKARGVTGLPDSFIEWLLERVTGANWSTPLVDALTVMLGLAAFVLSVALNLRARRR